MREDFKKLSRLHRISSSTPKSEVNENNSDIKSLNSSRPI